MMKKKMYGCWELVKMTSERYDLSTLRRPPKGRLFYSNSYFAAQVGLCIPRMRSVGSLSLTQYREWPHIGLYVWRCFLPCIFWKVALRRRAHVSHLPL